MGWPMHIVAAAGYVFDEQERILLVKTYARGWDVPGGQIEEGESLEEGLLREIYEESGITAQVERLIGVYSNTGKYLCRDGVTEVPTKLMLDFRCKYMQGACASSEETSASMWVTKEQALEMVTAPAQRYRLQIALEEGEQIVYGTYITRPEFRLTSQRYI